MTRFQSSAKVDSDCFCQLISCFCGGMETWSSVLHHSQWTIMAFYFEWSREPLDSFEQRSDLIWHFKRSIQASMSRLDNCTTLSEADPFLSFVICASVLAGERQEPVPEPWSCGWSSPFSISARVWDSSLPSADLWDVSLETLEYKKLTQTLFQHYLFTAFRGVWIRFK